MLEQIQKQADEFVHKLHSIFDILDKETSGALIQPSLDQLIGLITNPDKATGRGMNIVPNELASWGMSNGINVLKDGKPIGAASLEQLIHAIARPTGEKKGIESYSYVVAMLVNYLR